MPQVLKPTAVVTAWQQGSVPATGYIDLAPPSSGSAKFDSVIFTHLLTAPRTVRSGTQVTELRLNLAALPTEIVPNPKGDTLQLRVAVSRSPNPATTAERADQLIAALEGLLKSGELRQSILSGSRLMNNTFATAV